MATVVLALANKDFDPTEAAVPWKVLIDAGHTVVFATDDGQPGACDADMIEGVLLGAVKATKANAALYDEMTQAAGYATPIGYEDISLEAHDALVLPGGHAPGMRRYLEAEALQAASAAFLEAGKPVAAICHGTIVLARAQGSEGPILRGRTMTCLPKTMEWSAWAATKMTRGDYFRTYPEWVQDEVEAAVGGKVKTGPLVPTYGNPFTVRDGNLLTARWPGDAAAFAAELVAMLAEPSPEA
jgi:putative intracellular protease/amidase